MRVTTLIKEKKELQHRLDLLQNEDNIRTPSKASGTNTTASTSSRQRKQQVCEMLCSSLFFMLLLLFFLISGQFWSYHYYHSQFRFLMCWKLSNIIFVVAACCHPSVFIWCTFWWWGYIWTHYLGQWASQSSNGTWLSRTRDWSPEERAAPFPWAIWCWGICDGGW